MSGIKYPIDIKHIGKFEHQNNISVNVYGYENKKKSSRYVLLSWPLQEITWIYYISLLAKHLITYCWKTLADWYQVNIIITTTKNISGNIVYMAAPVKSYSKTIWEDVSYTGHKESSFHKLTTRRGVIKSNLEKQSTNYVYLLSSTWVSKAFYVNKTSVSHHHQNLSPPTPQHPQLIPWWSCVYVKCSDGRYFEAPQVNIVDDAAEKFLDQILAAATICRQHLSNKILMKRLTQEQCKEYNSTTNCLVCAKPFKSADKKSPWPRSFDRWI